MTHKTVKVAEVDVVARTCPQFGLVPETFSSHFAARKRIAQLADFSLEVITHKRVYYMALKQ